MSTYLLQKDDTAARMRLIMFIRQTTSPNTKKIAIQVVESKREGKKVRQTILRHVGSSEDPSEIEIYKRMAEGIKLYLEAQRTLNYEHLAQRTNKKDFDDVSFKALREVGRYNRGISDVFGKLYDELDFANLFTGQHAERRNRILKSCVLARLTSPSSKLETTKQLAKKFSENIRVDSIYRMMDNLNSDLVKSAVRKATMETLQTKINVMLFDVTTLYFESVQQDELRAFGFSKDCKFKETQVVLALITTTEGLPISYRVFPGNTHEVKTLLPSLSELRQEFEVEKVEFAADRGMFCEQNLKLLEQSGVSYVVGAKLRSLDRATRAEILAIHQQQHEGEDNHLKKELKYGGRRLVISYNPDMAAKDRKDRQRLLGRLGKLTDTDGKVAAKNLIKNSGSKKYLRFDADKKLARVDDEKITADAAWDGISGYITNSKRSATTVIATYRRLWEIEASFRLTKHDLKVRPIYHYKADRIKAHLDICFVAYTLARQLMYRHQLQQSRSASFRELHNALSEAEFSILTHKETKESYVLSSNLSPLAKSLYRIVGLKPSSASYKI